jgi:hypothetical protein
MSTEIAQVVAMPSASFAMKTQRRMYSRKARVEVLIAIAPGAGGASHNAAPKFSVSMDNA